MNEGLFNIMLTDEYRYKIIKLVELRPEITQRELAEVLGISLGKANFCLQALMAVGVLKVSNFRNSQNKLAYMYLLTPKGVEEKTKVTVRFLRNKMHEYELLKLEIDALVKEVAHSDQKT